MENEFKPLDENSIPVTEKQIKIYSKRAIWGFSVFFTSIFGGVLLFQNLRDIGKKKEANLVLLFSIIFSVAIIYIVNIPEKPKSSLTLLCNMLGALILTEYFFQKYFPNQAEYEKKKIWKPFLISMAITIPIVLVMIYATSQEN